MLGRGWRLLKAGNRSKAPSKGPSGDRCSSNLSPSNKGKDSGRFWGWWVLSPVRARLLLTWLCMLNNHNSFHSLKTTPKSTSSIRRSLGVNLILWSPKIPPQDCLKQQIKMISKRHWLLIWTYKATTSRMEAAIFASFHGRLLCLGSDPCLTCKVTIYPTHPIPHWCWRHRDKLLL